MMRDNLKKEVSVKGAEVQKKDEKGASMVEYILLVALIALIAIAALTFLGNQVSNRFSTAGSAMIT